ncbi:MAG: deaminase [Nanoarchaeota archaeon]
MNDNYFNILQMNERERDLYFLRGAFQIARDFSQDENTETGAIIVSPDFSLISIGANRRNFGDPLRYEGRGERTKVGRPDKYAVLVHAEPDALFGASRNGKSIMGCTIYATWVPCEGCAKATVNSGIKRYITHESTREWYREAQKNSGRVDWQESTDEAVKIFKKSGVEYLCLSDKIGGVEILFDDKQRSP